MSTELAVQLNGVVRQITGEVDSSNSADVIYALAQATNQRGRFILVLVDRTNKTEYFLRPHEIPYDALQSLLDRGIDAYLELRTVDKTLDSGSLLMRKPSTETISNIPITTDETLRQEEFEHAVAQMNTVELEEFCRTQDQTLQQQQVILANIENELYDAVEKEYLQTLRQRNNLRQMLSELEGVDWDAQRANELSELNHLNAAIESIRDSLEKRHCQLTDALREETKLAKEIGRMQKRRHPH